MIAPDDASSKASSSNHTPYLSHSRISRYLACPEQYRLYYVERLRPRLTPAALAFGQAIHQALAALFQHGEDPVGFFTAAWTEARDSELAFTVRESWETLSERGRALLETFARVELPKVGTAHCVERAFSLEVSGLDLPFVGIVDLVADVHERRTVVDFKTAASSYASHEARLSDQLTAYALAEPEAERTALCVLVKTKEPKIEWHFAERGAGDVLSYLAKAGIVAREIAADSFYKRPGRWCAWCDYLPVCMGDERKASETLVRIEG